MSKPEPVLVRLALEQTRSMEGWEGDSSVPSLAVLATQSGAWYCEDREGQITTREAAFRTLWFDDVSDREAEFFYTYSPTDSLLRAKATTACTAHLKVSGAVFNETAERAVTRSSTSRRTNFACVQILREQRLAS